MTAKNKLSLETTAIITAIEHASEAGRLIAASVSTELVTHTKHDDERFQALTELVTSVANDVKSLLESRSFTRGVWKAASVAGGSVGGLVAVIAFIVSWWRGH